MTTSGDLAGPLAEYVTEEIDNICAEVFGNKVCLYASTADRLSDGTSLSTYIGSLEIKEDRMLLLMGKNALSNTIEKPFNLEDPKSFDKLFCEIKEMIEDFGRTKLVGGTRHV